MKGMKKALALALVVAVTSAASIAGTLAYLTDRDSEVNEFTVGDVKIRLDETFDEENAVLLPGVDIQKEPTITNIGSNDAWVWAEIAFPAAFDNDDASKNVVHFNYSKESVEAGKWNWMKDGTWNVEKEVEIEGVKYNVYTVLYETALKPNEVTVDPVMTNVYMDPHVDIYTNGDWYHVENGTATKLDWNSKTNGDPVIYVSAYGIQAKGFDTVQDAYAAYQTQWGANGKEYGDITVETVATPEEFESALAKTNTIALSDTIKFEDADGKKVGTTIEEGVKADIDLNDNTLDAAFFTNMGQMTVSNGTIEAGSASDYASVNVGSAATAEYNDVEITSGGGGVAAAGGAKVVFNSGKVYVDTASTSGRYIFYAEGEGSEITINGGTFSWDPADNQKRAYIYAGAGTTVTVNGGTFGKASTRSGYTAGILGDGTVIIKGGTFGFDPSAWVAEGYEAVKSGTTWTVSAK